MTINVLNSLEMNAFENPLKLPVEELKLKFTASGNSYEELIPALDARWCNKHYVYTLYVPPPSKNRSGEYTMGSKEDWVERMVLLLGDFEMLLQLDFHRFWSEVINNTQCLDGMNSFLQRAPPVHSRHEMSKSKDICKVLRKMQKLVFLLLLRLTRAQESEMAWMNSSILGSILYNNFILSLPQLMDICSLYASDNFREVSDLIGEIVRVQPKYLDDVEKSAIFLNEVFSKLEVQLMSIEETNGMSTSMNGLMPSPEIINIILLILDTSYSLDTFLKVLSKSAKVYREHHLEPRIATFYGNSIPVLNRSLDLLFNHEGTQDVFQSHRHKLDLCRHLLISCVHECLMSCLSTVLEDRNSLVDKELKDHVDNYFNTISECLTADLTFMRDYNSAFPVSKDFAILSDVYPDLDTLKRDYILESVMSLYDVPAKTQQVPSSHELTTESPELMQNHTSFNGISEQLVKKKVTGVELESLITEVKDILPHLGDGYVVQCLEHFNYVTSDVINALLEGTIPEKLFTLDPELPIIPPEKPEGANSLPERINVFDNDEFDVMTQDQVDTTRIHKGKRHGKHRNMIEMLNDKSDVRDLRDMYTRLSLVECMEDAGDYDDEYDDTYDDVDTAVGNEGETEAVERRAFVTPRVLQQYKKSEVNESRFDQEEYEEEENGNEEAGRKPDLFIENPEVVRDRMAQRRLDQRGRRPGPRPPRDVVGKPKGQGQDETVIRSREFKSTNKSSQGNHNRRAMAAKKRRQGMFPS